MTIKFIFLIIVFGLGVCFGIALEDKSQILAVLTAFGTVGAVIWAVSRDAILKYINRPKLHINFYEPEPPYLRHVPPSQQSQRHQHVVTLSITNSGKSVAEACQPMVTKLWLKRQEEDPWCFPKGWVPLPLDWIFESQLQREHTNERDIVPAKPYLFNLCGIFENTELILMAPIKSRSQPAVFKHQTSYCIEVSVFSVTAKHIKKYHSRPMG